MTPFTRLLVVLVLIGLLQECVAWKAFDCVVPNDCTKADPGYSFCRENLCRQCDPTAAHKDCDCQVDEYCVSDHSNVPPALFNHARLSMLIIRTI